MTELDYQGQLRDQAAINAISKQVADGFCETQKEIAACCCQQTENALKTQNLIIETAQRQEIAGLHERIRCLTEKQEKDFQVGIASRTNCLVDQIGNALKVQFGASFPWQIPVCNTGCCGGI